MKKAFYWKLLQEHKWSQLKQESSTMGANLFIFLQKNTIQEKKPTQISMKHQSSKTTQQESKSSWNVRKKIFKHFKSCILFSHLSWCNFCSGNDFIHKTVVLCQHISSQLLQLDFDVFFWHICQGQCFHLTKKILNDLFTFLKWSEGKKEENKTEYLDYFQKLFSKLYHKYKVLFSTRNFLQEKKFGLALVVLTPEQYADILISGVLSQTQADQKKQCFPLRAPTGVPHLIPVHNHNRRGLQARDAVLSKLVTFWKNCKSKSMFPYAKAKNKLLPSNWRVALSTENRW